MLSNHFAHFAHCYINMTLPIVPKLLIKDTFKPNKVNLSHFFLLAYGSCLRFLYFGWYFYNNLEWPCRSNDKVTCYDGHVDVSHSTVLCTIHAGGRSLTNFKLAWKMATLSSLVMAKCCSDSTLLYTLIISTFFFSIMLLVLFCSLVATSVDWVIFHLKFVFFHLKLYWISL